MQIKKIRKWLETSNTFSELLLKNDLKKEQNKTVQQNISRNPISDSRTQ